MGRDIDGGDGKPYGQGRECEGEGACCAAYPGSEAVMFLDLVSTTESASGIPCLVFKGVSGTRMGTYKYNSMFKL